MIDIKGGDRFVKCFGRLSRYDAASDTQIYGDYRFQGKIWVIRDGNGITFMKPEDY